MGDLHQLTEGMLETYLSNSHKFITSPNGVTQMVHKISLVTTRPRCLLSQSHQQNLLFAYSPGMWEPSCILRGKKKEDKGPFR